MLRALGLVLLMSCFGPAGLTVGEAGGGGGCHAPLSQGSGAKVELESNCFGPTILRIEPGAAVEWLNRDQARHDVNGAGGAWGANRIIDYGQSVSQTFEEAGTFPYYCSLHPGMIGVVVVGDGAFGEATIADGLRAAGAIPPSETKAGGGLDYESTAGRSGETAATWLSLGSVLGFIGSAGALALLRRSRAHTG